MAKVKRLDGDGFITDASGEAIDESLFENDPPIWDEKIDQQINQEALRRLREMLSEKIQMLNE